MCSFIFYAKGGSACNLSRNETIRDEFKNSISSCPLYGCPSLEPRILELGEHLANLFISHGESETQREKRLAQGHIITSPKMLQHQCPRE